LACNSKEKKTKKEKNLSINESGARGGGKKNTSQQRVGRGKEKTMPKHHQREIFKKTKKSLLSMVLNVQASGIFN